VRRWRATPDKHRPYATVESRWPVRSAHGAACNSRNNRARAPRVSGRNAACGTSDRRRSDFDEESDNASENGVNAETAVNGHDGCPDKVGVANSEASVGAAPVADGRCTCAILNDSEHAGAANDDNDDASSPIEHGDKLAAHRR
jgi:hypothetical protein